MRAGRLALPVRRSVDRYSGTSGRTVKSLPSPPTLHVERRFVSLGGRTCLVMGASKGMGRSVAISVGRNETEGERLVVFEPV